MEEKKSKLNLIWVIPEILGTIGIAVSGVIQLYRLLPIEQMGLWNWVFMVSLCGVVIFAGLKGFSHSIDELKKVI
jgi:hypothetical protein